MAAVLHKSDVALTPPGATAAQSGVLGRLDTARRSVEGRFLEAGESLGQAVEGVGDLIDSLDNLTRTLDPATVAATIADFRTAAQALESLPERHAERRRNIKRMDESSGELARCVGEMRRNLAYLRIFAINIKITGVAAASGQTRGQADFGVFAQEISDCIDLGQTRLHAFEADLLKIAGEFGEALKQEQTLASFCDRHLTNVTAGLASCSEEIASHHERVGQVAVEVSTLAREIRKTVGGGLAALQIGDITRQRIEHVQQALVLLDQAEDEAAPVGAFVFALAAAQLRAASVDFHRDVERIGQSMSSMAGDASEILRLRDLTFGRAGDGDGAFLRRLDDHVVQALSLADGVEKADTAAVQVGAAAAAATSNLVTQIGGLQSIRADVQQMALNTTIKCSRMGDAGKPLAVIAYELRSHSAEMEASARDAHAALDIMAGEAGVLSKSRVSGDLEISASAALTQASQRLREAGDITEDSLASLAQQGETVVRMLKMAATRLNFEREIGGAMDQSAAELARNAGRPQPPSDDQRRRLEPLLAAIAKTYTMAEEREVQRVLADGWGLAEEPAKPATAPADDSFDDVLF